MTLEAEHPTALSDLYQEVILDHNKHPQNVGVLSPATHRAEGYNPLCGDRLTLTLQMEGDVIREIRFEGSGCAISKASSSIMTDLVKGKTRQEVETLFTHVHELLTESPTTRQPQTTSPLPPATLEKLNVFSGVAAFPARVKCATLAWHTLRAAFDKQQTPISTEETHPAAGSTASLEAQVIDALKTCFDPEIPVNIYELGLIYKVDVTPEQGVHITMTLTSPMCPVAGSLPPEVESKVRALPGVRDAKVTLVWDPPWTQDMMTEAARLQLGL